MIFSHTDIKIFILLDNIWGPIEQFPVRKQNEVDGVKFAWIQFILSFPANTFYPRIIIKDFLLEEWIHEIEFYTLYSNSEMVLILF